MVGVGVGVADSGAGAAPPPEPYYGEYYQEQLFVPEMCLHPQQHPQHAHVCAVHSEYGGMPVVTSGTMMPQMMQPVMDENMRHYLVPHPHAPPPLPHGHHPPQHHQGPPHHQPPLQYANGGGGPQHFYNAGYATHYHVPPHHLPHYNTPPVYQNQNERAQRQYTKLKQKLERKQNNRNNGIEVNSGASTPSLSPRKELNGRGAWSEGEGSSAGASLQSDDDDTQLCLDNIAAQRTPQVSEITATSALVQWNAPLPEGVSPPAAAPELTYDLLLGDRGRYKAIYSGPKLSCRVCDLRPGCEYSVRLQVRAGDAAATSEEAVFRARAAPPAAPAAPDTSVRRTTLTLRWHAPPDHGARIEHYILELHDGDAWRELARPRARHHAAADLRPLTAYRLRLAAVNACGRGAWSDETVAWTGGAPPPAPAPPRLAAAAPDRLALAWDPAPPQHEYTLQAEDAAAGHGFLPVYSGPDDRCECTELRRATEYRFRLRAETSDGAGPWSAEVAYSTLPQAPGAPGRPGIKGKPHSRALRLRWDAPVDSGGAPVERYTLELDAGAGWSEAWAGAEREALCERLQPGAEYRARVAATGPGGRGPWSVAERVGTEPARPAAPAPPAPASPARATSAALRWTAPDCDGGAPLTEYLVVVTDARGQPAATHTGPDTECIVRDLEPATEYEATVAAVNRVGSGPASAPLAFKTPAAPPDAPAVPLAELQAPAAARVSWEPPRDNGAPVLDYRLEVSAGALEDAFSAVYEGLDTSRLVENLLPFTPYLFRVCARNAAGRGAWSGARDVLTPPAAPAAPPAPAVAAELRALHVTWRPAAARGVPVLRHLVRVGERELQADGAELTVTDLEPDTAYSVRVAGDGELGVGLWSPPTEARTLPPPPPPPRLECVLVAHNYLKLRWGDEGGEDDGTQYRLEMRGADSREFRPAYRGAARSCKVKKLREASAYWFRVRAQESRGGRGEWSEPLEARTAAAPPPAPPAPDAAWSGARLALRWAAERALQYEVQAAAPGGAWRACWAGAGGECELADAAPEGQVRLRARAGSLPGAWSAPVRVPALPVAARARPARPRARALAPRHAALLLAGGFLLLAVVVAAALQGLVSPRA